MNSIRRCSLRFVISAILFLGYCSTFVLARQEAETFQGKVVAVSDGDTITVRKGRQEAKVRLYGVDCPESRQPYGKTAMAFTSKYCLGKDVRVEAIGRDPYGRYVGRVFLLDEPHGESLNEALVREGLAWWYKDYAPREERLKELEVEARQARKGLWSDDHAVAPWQWRRDEQSPQTVAEASLQLPPAVIWLFAIGTVVGLIGSFIQRSRFGLSKTQKRNASIIITTVEIGLAVALGLLMRWWIGVLFFIWMCTGASRFSAVVLRSIGLRSGKRRRRR